MKTVAMICQADQFQYPPGVYHSVGEEFDVEEGDAKILSVTGKAKQKPEVKDFVARKDYATRDIIHARRTKAITN